MPMRDPLTFPIARPAGRRDRPVALELTGRSPAVSRLQELVRRAASGVGAVLLVAEAGAEPEPIARDLHGRSSNAAGPYIVIDCSNGDAATLERELFGRSGAPAAADFESIAAGSALAAARTGTLFLRDVTELPAAIQARLARLVRDGEMVLGGSVVPAAIRVIASASRSIDHDVHERRFRGDLYRRISSIRIDIPSLAERGDDLPELAEAILDEICAARGVPARTFTQAALALVAAVRWPGNLVELRTAIDRIAAATDVERVHVEHVLPALQLERASPAFAPSGTLREARQQFERAYVAAVLQHHGWRMADAAQTLGMQRPNLYRKARQLGIPLTRIPD